MAVIKYADGSSITANKILGEAIIRKIVISEELGGGIPTIKMELESTDQLVDIPDVVEGVLTNYQGNSWKYYAYCYNVKIEGERQEISLMCLDPEMTRTPKTNQYKSVSDAIYSSYKAGNNSILNYPSGADQSVTMYQKQESDLDFCTKCCNSLVNGVIFGYTLSGLKFVDLRNITYVDKINKLSHFRIVGDVSVAQPKTHDLEEFEDDFSVGNDPYHKLVRYNNQYVPVDLEYIDVTKTNLHNKRYLDPKMSINAESNIFLGYSIGDALEIIDGSSMGLKLNFNKCFITKRVIELTDATVKMSLTLQSMEI